MSAESATPRVLSRPAVRGRLSPAHLRRLRWTPVAPVLATVLVLCAPVPTGDAAAPGGVTFADGASVLLVTWCGVRLLRGRGGPLTPLGALVFGAPTVAFAVATAASADPSASLPGFLRSLQIFVLVPLAVLLVLRDARDFRLLCGALVVLALVQGGVGVVQNVTGTGASFGGRTIRAVGTFGPLDVMGMATVVAYGLVAAVALGLGARDRTPRGLRPAALCAAAALVVPLILSYSRGAWIASAAACTVVLFLSGARRAVVVLAALTAGAVVVIGGFGVGSAQVGERFASITDVSSAPDRSVDDRYSLWSAAAAMWRDEPATGVGPKNFASHRDSHAPLGLSSGSDTEGAGQDFRREPLLSPHNMYLLLLSEQGLVGTTAVAGGWVALLVVGVRRHREARSAGARDCGLAAVGLLVWQTVDFLYADIGGPSTVLTAVALGMAAWWALHPSPAAGDEAAAR
ncbi:O-antigen ligase family protein [Streptomyces sulphureus]|uniref:O-antigen ligase family protein n=1 Tax=Streptomyces sulphureus TaxID=47758 RepID=UPI00035FED2E|nr:O-antigen ligase family protein [Streptomyces sulphureus]